jgi:molybdopterin-guanine dinucleotide biosynthesis protein A
VREHIPPASTCFLNEDGYAEPLIALWGPEALERLKKNVEKARNGLNFTLREVGAKMIKPEDESGIKGANSRREWDEAMVVLRERNQGSVEHAR